jgi:hypothetical protein
MTRMFQRENPVGDLCFFEQVAPPGRGADCQVLCGDLILTLSQSLPRVPAFPPNLTWLCLSPGPENASDPDGKW